MTDTRDANQSRMLEAVEQYFIRADAGRADALDLFTDDVQLYFPKFGIAKGKQAFGELASGLLGSLGGLGHDLLEVSLHRHPRRHRSGRHHTRSRPSR